MSTTRKSFILKLLSVIFVFALGISALLYVGAGKSNTVYADSYTGHATDNVFMVDGASVRVANGSGIRFTAYYNKTYIDGLDNPTIGMFIAKSENVDGELTAATAKKQDCVMVNWSGETAYHYIYKCVLTGIPKAYYGTELVARAYVLVDDVYTYNAEQVGRSVAYVAEKALLSGEFDDNASATAVLNEYVSNNSFTIARSSAKLAIGYSLDLANTDFVAKWESSDTSVATVDGNGKVSAVAAGTATITATYGNTTCTCTVSVLDKTVDTSLVLKNSYEAGGLYLGYTLNSVFTAKWKTLTSVGSMLYNGVDTSITWQTTEWDALYAPGMPAGRTSGDTLLFKKGFGFVYDDKVYVLSADYLFTYDGSRWSNRTYEYPLSLTVPTTDSSSDIIYIQGSVDIKNTLGIGNWVSLSIYGTDGGIYKNGEKITSPNIHAFQSTAFYIQDLAGVAGDVITIKKGTTIAYGSYHYIVDNDYVFTYVPYDQTLTSYQWARDFGEVLTFYYAPQANIRYCGSNLGKLYNNSDSSAYFTMVEGAVRRNGVKLGTRYWTTKTDAAGDLFWTNYTDGSAIGDVLTIERGTAFVYEGTGRYLYRASKDYNLVWDGSYWRDYEPMNDSSLSLTSVHASSGAGVLYINGSKYLQKTGYANWAAIPRKGTSGGIYKNGVEISYSNLCAAEFCAFYVQGLSAVAGDTVLVKKHTKLYGKDCKFYVVDDDYYFQYNGSTWVMCSKTMMDNAKPLKINAYYGGNGSTCYLVVSNNFGNSYDAITVYGDILKNDSQASISAAGVGGANYVIYLTLGAAANDVFTIKKDTIIRKGSDCYKIDKDYTLTWTGSTWTIVGEENIDMSFSAPVTSITSRSAIYLREDVNVYGTTGAAKWSAVSVSGSSPEFNGETFTPAVQVCEWSNDLYLTGFGTAANGDELFIPAGFKVSKSSGSTLYTFTSSSDIYFTYYGNVGWKLKDSIEFPETERSFYFSGYWGGGNNYTQFVISSSMGTITFAAGTAVGDATYYKASDGTTSYKTLTFSANSTPYLQLGGFTAAAGDIITLKKGFRFIVDSTTYYLDTAWQFTYSGSAWSCATYYEQEPLNNVFKLGNFGAPNSAIYDKYAAANYNYVLYDQNNYSFTTTGTTQANVEAFKTQERYLYETYGIYSVPMVFADNASYTQYTNNLDTEGYAGKFFEDEPEQSRFSTIAGYITAFEANNPYATFYNNLYPIYNSEFNNSYTSYKAYIEAYCETVLSRLSGNKVIMVDIYPLVSSGNGKGVDTTDADSDGIVDRYLANLEILAQAAKKYGASVEIIYQLGTLYNGDKQISDSVTSLAKLRFQFSAALAYGVKGLWSFDYVGSSVVHDTVAADSLATTVNTQLQNHIKNANADVKAFADVYMQYTYKGTGIFGSTNNCWNHLENTIGWTKISSVSGTQSTLCGEFYKGDKYAYVVSNFNYSTSNTVNLTFTESVKGYYLNGNYTACDANTTSLTLDLTAGACAFVVLN